MCRDCCWPFSCKMLFRQNTNSNKTQILSSYIYDNPNYDIYTFHLDYRYTSLLCGRAHIFSVIGDKVADEWSDTAVRQRGDICMVSHWLGTVSWPPQRSRTKLDCMRPPLCPPHKPPTPRYHFPSPRITLLFPHPIPHLYNLVAIKEQRHMTNSGDTWVDVGVGSWGRGGD